MKRLNKIQKSIVARIIELIAAGLFLALAATVALVGVGSSSARTSSPGCGSAAVQTERVASRVVCIWVGKHVTRTGYWCFYCFRPICKP